jgi:hypothetical protein
MKIINETILTLQMKSISAVHLYDVMFKLLIKLKNRLEVKYFSSKISEILKNTNNKIKKKFEEEALFAYERTIDYLEKWFDFKDSIFKTFTELNLEKAILHENLIFIVNSLGINANTDDLFDECFILNDIISNFTLEDKMLDNDKLWCKILKPKKDEKNSFPNLKKIVQTVLSIPISNDTVERVFSLMKRIWTDRNSMKTDLVKAEICINFIIQCLALISLKILLITLNC